MKARLTEDDFKDAAFANQLAAEQKSVDELSLHSQDLAHELAEARAEIARLRKTANEYQAMMQSITELAEVLKAKILEDI